MKPWKLYVNTVGPLIKSIILQECKENVELCAINAGKLLNKNLPKTLLKQLNKNTKSILYLYADNVQNGGTKNYNFLLNLFIITSFLITIKLLNNNNPKTNINLSSFEELKDFYLKDLKDEKLEKEVSYEIDKRLMENFSHKHWADWDD